MNPNEKIIKNLLITLRGEKSQLEMSSLMGYKYNYYNKLENCRKKITWTEFCHIAEKMGYDLKWFFIRYLGFPGENFDFTSPPVILHQMFLMQQLHLDQIAKSSKFRVHAATLKRRMGSKTLSLEIMLDFLTLYPELHANFLRVFSPANAKNKDIRYQFLSSDVLKKYQFEYISFNPWVLTFIEYFRVHSKQYRSSKLISEVSDDLQIPSSVVERTIRDMVDLKLLTIKNEIVEPYGQHLDFTQAPIQLILKQMQYWGSKIHARIDNVIQGTPKSKGVVYYSDLRVAGVDEEAFSKIQEIITKASSEVVAVMKNQKSPPKKIICYLASLLSPDVNHKDENLEGHWTNS